MPMEFVIHITGHDLRTLSALFNYLRPYIVLQTAGGLVLAGWPAPPYGRLSNEPIPASLGPILNLGGAMDRLKAMINCLFQFDTTTPGEYLIGGNLEPLTKAFFASMVKCYKLRYTSGLMSPVLARMRTAYVDAFGGFPGDAHETLLRWSGVVDTKFEEDNLHLTGRWISESEFSLMATVRSELAEVRANQLTLSAQFEDLLRRLPATTNPSTTTAATTVTTNHPPPPPFVPPPAPPSPTRGVLLSIF